MSHVYNSFYNFCSMKICLPHEIERSFLQSDATFSANTAYSAALKIINFQNRFGSLFEIKFQLSEKSYPY